MGRQVLGWSLASLLLCIMQFGWCRAALLTNQESIAKHSYLPWNGTNVNQDVSSLNVVYGHSTQNGTLNSPRDVKQDGLNKRSQAGAESLRSKYRNTKRQFHVDNLKLRNRKFGADAVPGSISQKESTGVGRKPERLENTFTEKAARVAANRLEVRRFKREQVDPQPQQFALEIPNVNDSGFVANQQEQDGHRSYFDGQQNEGSNSDTFQSKFRYPNSEIRRGQHVDSDFVNPDNRNFDEQQQHQQQQQQPQQQQHNTNNDAIQNNYESTSEPQDGKYSQTGHLGNEEHDFRSMLPRSGENNLQEDIVKSENTQENQDHLDYQRSVFPSLNLLNNRQPLFPQNNFGGNGLGQYNQIPQNNMNNAQVPNAPYGHNAHGNAPNAGNSYQNPQIYPGAQYPVQTNNYNENSPLQKLQERLQKSDIKLQSILQNFKNKDCPQLPCIPQYPGNYPPQYPPVPQYSNNQPPQYAPGYNPPSNTVYNPQQNYGYNPQQNYGYNPQQNTGYNPQKNIGYAFDPYANINPQQTSVYNPHQYAGLNQQQNPGYIPQQNTGYNPGALMHQGGVLQPNGLQLPSLLHPNGIGALFPHNPFDNQARMAGEDEDSNDQEPEGVEEVKARKNKEKASQKDCDESKTDKFRAATEEEDEETDPCAEVKKQKNKGKPAGDKFRAVPDSTEDLPAEMTTESSSSEFIDGQFVSGTRYALKPKNAKEQLLPTNAKEQPLPTNVRIGEFVNGQWILSTAEATTETSIGQGRSAIEDEGSYENDIISQEGIDDNQYFPDDATNTKSTFGKVSDMNPYSKFEMNVFNIHPVKDAESKSSAAVDPKEGVQSIGGPSARMSNNDNTIEDEEEGKAGEDPPRGSDNTLVQPGLDMLQLPIPGPLRISDFLQRRRQAVDDTIRKINEDTESRITARIKALANRDNLNYNPMGRNAGNSDALNDNRVNTFPGLFRNMLIPPPIPLWSPVDTRPMQGNLQQRRNQNKEKLLGASFEKTSQESKGPCRRSYNGTITSDEICEIEKSKRDLNEGNNSTDDAQVITDVEETDSNIGSNGTKSQQTELQTKNFQTTEIDVNKLDGKPDFSHTQFMASLNSEKNRNAESETDPGNATTPSTNTAPDTARTNTGFINDSTMSPSEKVPNSKSADDSKTKDKQEEDVLVTTDAQVVNASSTLYSGGIPNSTYRNKDITDESSTDSTLTPHQNITVTKMYNESDSESISESSNKIDVLGVGTAELVTTPEVINANARQANSKESVNVTTGASSISSSSSEGIVLNETISEGEETNNNKTAPVANKSAQSLTLNTTSEVNIKNKTLDNFVTSSDLEILNNSTITTSEESIVSSKRSVNNVVTTEENLIINFADNSTSDTSSNSTTTNKLNDSVPMSRGMSLNNSIITSTESLNDTNTATEAYDLSFIDVIDKTSDEKPSYDKPTGKDYGRKSGETKLRNKSSSSGNELQSDFSNTDIKTETVDKNITQNNNQNNGSDIESAALKPASVRLDINNMSNLTEKEREGLAHKNFPVRNNIVDISDSNTSGENDSSLTTIEDNESVSSEGNATQQINGTTNITEIDAYVKTKVTAGILQEKTNTNETTPIQVNSVTVKTTDTSEAEGKSEIILEVPIEKNERSANGLKNMEEIPPVNLTKAIETTPENVTDTTELRAAEQKNITEIPEMELNTTTEIKMDEIKNKNVIADELKNTTEIIPGEMENKSEITSDSLRNAPEIGDVDVPQKVIEIDSSEPVDVTELAQLEIEERTDIAQDETKNTTVMNITGTRLDELKNTTETAIVKLNGTESTTESVIENICQKHIREMAESEVLEKENINPSFKMSEEFVQKIIKQMREKYPEDCEESNISTEILEYSVKSIIKWLESIGKPELETGNQS